jgi:hypothetical protein
MSLVLLGLLAWLVIGAAVGVPIGRILRATNPIDEV